MSNLSRKNDRVPKPGHMVDKKLIWVPREVKLGDKKFGVLRQVKFLSTKNDGDPKRDQMVNEK